MDGQFRNILCVLQDTQRQDEIVTHAIQIAKAHQANLTVMLTLEELPPNANMVMESFAYLESQTSVFDGAKLWLNKQARKWSKDYNIENVVTLGHPLEDIISRVVNHGHDLVIKHAENEHSDTVSGSGDMQLLRKCPCPVWIAHRHHPHNYKNVIAAIDLNYHYPQHEVSARKALALDILRVSIQIALINSAQLHIVHVFDEVPESIMRTGFISVDEDVSEQDLSAIRKEREDEVDALLNELNLQTERENFASLTPQKHLVSGYPREEIAATAAGYNADVVVMGTSSRLGVPGYIMGGTAEETLQKLQCAVVGLKPPGFVTPITVIPEDEQTT